MTGCEVNDLRLTTSGIGAVVGEGSGRIFVSRALSLYFAPRVFSVRRSRPFPLSSARNVKRADERGNTNHGHLAASPKKKHCFTSNQDGRPLTDVTVLSKS